MASAVSGAWSLGLVAQMDNSGLNPRLSMWVATALAYHPTTAPYERPLVRARARATGTVIFHPAYLAFCRDWDVQPRACAPYRARTKGKTEAGVKYVKRSGAPTIRVAFLRRSSESARPSGVLQPYSPPCRRVRLGRASYFTFFAVWTLEHGIARGQAEGKNLDTNGRRA
jgi:hypothetical protein